MNSWSAGERNGREKPKMKALYCGAFASVVAIAGLTHAQSAKKQAAAHESAREKLIGAWHLARIEATGQDGKPIPVDRMR
jgi:hypothetical protein